MLSRSPIVPTMVLHQPKVTGSQKVDNRRAMKKETKRIKRTRVSKEVGATVSTPLCRSINRWGNAVEKTQKQLHVVLGRLAAINAPYILFQLTTLLFLNVGGLKTDLDMVEYFAGEQAVTHAWASAGFRACPFEMKLDPLADILSTKGFVLALMMALMVKDHGFAMIATVCSSWVFVNRATSKRSVWNPLGDTHVKSVALANEMVSRMALILWVLESKRCLWLYEQPQTSLLWEHHRMQEYLSKNIVYKVHTWMGAFGAATPKGTHLWGPQSSILKFALPLPQRQWSEQLVTI